MRSIPLRGFDRDCATHSFNSMSNLMSLFGSLPFAVRCHESWVVVICCWIARKIHHPCQKLCIAKGSTVHGTGRCNDSYLGMRQRDLGRPYRANIAIPSQVWITHPKFTLYASLRILLAIWCRRHSISLWCKAVNIIGGIRNCNYVLSLLWGSNWRTTPKQ